MTDEMKLDARPPKLFAKTPNGEDVVSMVVHKGILIVSTASNVYQLSEEGVFTVIMFEMESKKKYVPVPLGWC